jgi:hypothetical protein
MMKVQELIRRKRRLILMQNDEKKKANTDKEKSDLKGTFISVMILGAFLVISWIGAFTLFLSR